MLTAIATVVVIRAIIQPASRLRRLAELDDWLSRLEQVEPDEPPSPSGR